MNESEMKEAYMSALEKRAPEGILQRYHELNTMFLMAREHGKFPKRHIKAQEKTNSLKEQLDTIEVKMILLEIKTDAFSLAL